MSQTPEELHSVQSEGWRTRNKHLGARYCRRWSENTEAADQCVFFYYLRLAFCQRCFSCWASMTSIAVGSWTAWKWWSYFQTISLTTHLVHRWMSRWGGGAVCVHTCVVALLVWHAAPMSSSWAQVVSMVDVLLQTQDLNQDGLLAPSELLSPALPHTQVLYKLQHKHNELEMEMLYGSSIWCFTLVY